MDHESQTMQDEPAAHGGSGQMRRSVSEILSVLANPNRVEVLFHLSDTPKPVSDMAHELEMEESNVSHTLQAFRRLGLVHAERLKKFRYYRLASGITVSKTATTRRLRIHCQDGAVALERAESSARASPHSKPTD